MIFFGIDPSLTATGWAVLNPIYPYQYDKIGTMGVIKTKPYPHGPLGRTYTEMGRIHSIIIGLLQVFPKLSSGDFDTPEKITIAVEGYSFGAYGNAIFQIGELGGIIRYDFWNRGFTDIEEWPPTTWRKVIFGKGNLSKKLEPELFKSMYGLTGDLNALEAWAIAKTSEIYHQGKKSWNQKQKEAFEKFV